MPETTEQYRTGPRDRTRARLGTTGRGETVREGEQINSRTQLDDQTKPDQERVDPLPQKRRAMAKTRTGAWALPDDPEELRDLFLKRAQDRDRAGIWDGKLCTRRAPAKTPKGTRDNEEPEEKPTKPNRGPRPKNNNPHETHGGGTPPKEDRWHQ